jgi:Xaa-Pro dipeptidase
MGRRPRPASAIAGTAAGPTSSLETDIRRQRIRRGLPEAMDAAGVAWFAVLTREHTRDPFAEEVGLGHVGARAAAVFHRPSSIEFYSTAFVAPVNAAAVAASDLYDRVAAYGREGLRPHLAKVFADSGSSRLALNVSRDLAFGDGLTAGLRDYLVSALEPGAASRFVSSEEILLTLLGRKLPAEIQLLDQAAVATQGILTEVLSSNVITPDTTTAGAMREALTQATVARGMQLGFATIRIGAHPPQLLDAVATRGDLVSIDFGVMHCGYCSDIQRTAYLLRNGETSAPTDIGHMWDVTRAAQRTAVQALQPGARGLDVDIAGRAVIERAGFRGYDHATGHPLGRRVHDVGPMLGPDWPERYGGLVHATIAAGQVFAVEPMVYGHAPSQCGEIRMGLEENVVVEAEGPRVFGTPQHSLILIG